MRDTGAAMRRSARSTGFVTVRTMTIYLWHMPVIYFMPQSWLTEHLFWASVLALGWFSHGVMSAWSHPETRWLALIEIALALLVIFSASLPGLRARFGKRR